MNRQTQVSAEHARKNLRAVLDLALQGDVIEVVRHGRLAAVIIGPRLWQEVQAMQAEKEKKVE